MAATESPVTAPPPGWARRLPRDERVFLWLVGASVVFMSAFTIGWLYLGGQNVPSASYRTSPQAFARQVNALVARYKGPDGRVYLPPGTTGYLMAARYTWYPELVLEAGQRYRIWISSADVLHGFSLVGHGENLNLEIAPDHAFGADFTPDEPGRYLIVCNEYCGLGHANMKGHLDVVSAQAMAAHLARARPGATQTTQQAAPGTPAVGKEVFTSAGCAGCHTFRPAGSSGTVGPDLDRLAEYARKAGEPLAQFIRSAIVSPPAAYVPPAYPTNVMPTSFGASLTPQQIAGLVAFLSRGHK